MGGVPGVDGTASALFADGGGTGALMAAHDWSATEVGPVEGWPASLRFAVRTVLASRFPMVLTWGAGYLQFYNDAYAPLIGAKHPAIGVDIRETLAEGWAALSGPVEHAMSAREASWLPRLPLLLERAGYREETYFTVSHAPAYDDDGSVSGMHAVCTEVTAEVLAERRQQLLRDLAAAGQGGGHPGDAASTAARMCAALAGDPLDLPFAGIWLADDAGTLRRVAVVGCPDDALPDAVDLADLPTDVPTDVAGLGRTGGLWGDPVREAVVLALQTPGSPSPVGALLLARTPARQLDDELRAFHSLVAGQFAAGLTTAEAFTAQRRRAEALAELDRAKTTFFSDVSHELRTPLTLLLGPLGDVLADPSAALAGPVREELAVALRNGQRLERLVDDLMDVVRIEAGRSELVREPVDLAAHTAELAGVLRAAAERAGLRLVVDCPPLPAPLLVDPRVWEKVVLNLVANAVKYTFVGDIRVALRPADDAPAAPAPGTALPVVLTVADTGIGIPAAELDRVFDRFHRVADARARTREGTGIGLSLVRELVTLHGGRVAARSVPGEGSTFTVQVAPEVADRAPAARPEPSPAARGAAAAWERDVGPVHDPAPAGPAVSTVLVVDDNADMRSYLVRMLYPGHRVRTAADGEQALAVLAEQVPDVLVTDVMMPRVDGFDLLRRLRSDPRTADVPVLVLTARAGQEAAVESFAAGVDDHLAKPFRSAELLARVAALVARPSRRHAATAVVPSPRGATTPAGPPSRAPGVQAVTEVRIESGRSTGHGHWRLAATGRAPAALRAPLRELLTGAGVDDDQVEDLLLAACEAVTNAVEHAQHPTEPVVDVEAVVDRDAVEVTVRDTGQWRERTPSMDRGRGSVLMAAAGEVAVRPGPGGTTVVVRAPRGV